MRRTYFLSDLHLNSNSSDIFLRLEKFLKKISVEDAEVYFLGDVFEFFSPLNSFSLTENLKFFELIKKLKMEKRIFLLEGNHEFFLESHKDDRIIEMFRSPISIKKGKFNIYLSHGDELAGGSIFNVLFRNFIKSKLFKRFVLLFPQKWIWKLALFLSSLSRRKNFKPSEKLRRNIKKRALKLLDYFDMVIVGHSHYRESSNLRGKWYINVGSFREGDVLILDDNGVKFIKFL